MRKRGWKRHLLVACAAAVFMAPLPGVVPIRAWGQDAPKVGPVTGLPMPRFVSLRSESANARRGPGLDQRVDWEFVRRGLPVEVTAEYGNWRRVRDSDGIGGWVHQSLLSGVRTALVQGEEPVPLRSGSDPDDRVRALVEPGVILRIRHCAENLCRVTVESTDGWIDQTVLWGVTPGEVVE